MNVLFEYDKIYEKGKREGAIKELEKIKAEFKKECEKRGGYYGFGLGFEIIDKHISELKEKPKIEKIDCNNTDCKNCLNHNDCDYENLN